ncbi:MAG: T9SS type A sorting domain-containing protein, partial [Calditrichaceae bacterium]|nr:T9SS type A sorting domain-containing protein [Calditrichaceae bacterium]
IEDDYFVSTTYVGAFGGNNWLLGWTALDQLGYTTAIVENNQFNNQPVSFSLEQNYPNPFNPITTIEFHLPSASLVELNIFNVLGQKVAALINGNCKAGVNKVQFNAQNLASGMYLYKLKTSSGTISKKMLLLK